MPSLERVLRDHDLGLLQVIAELWGLELAAPSQREAAEALARQMRQPELLAEIVETLPPEARAALRALQAQPRLPLAAFTRRHGELRVMGAARRDREQPWLNGPSASEALWYRGLLGRAFFDEDLGPQEFVFIPDELRALLPASAPADDPPGQPAASAEPETWASSLHLAADDVTSLLAYLQVAAVRLEAGAFPRRHRDPLTRFLRQPEALDLLLHLIQRLGLAEGTPLKLDPARARPFLESSQAEQVAILAPAWRASTEWNDLRQMPGLLFDGAWRNDPVHAREAVLGLLKQVPPGMGWSLESFVAALKERQPDFQRPAGDYDSWYLRDAASQASLRGVEHWERVDGALVRWLITRPLHWLGLVDLARSPAAFRLTPYGQAFLGQADWPAGAAEPRPITVSADGVIRVPAAASPYDRFQVARVCNWLPPEAGVYPYRLAPTSLARAAKQGIKVSHILGFLQKAAGAEPAPALAGALHRWERSGAEASLKEMVVLRLRSRELLETLRRTPSVKRFLRDGLGPDAVEVRREDLEALRKALAELGILAD